MMQHDTRRRSRAIVRAVAEAVHTSDAKTFFRAALPLLQGDRDAWPHLMRAIEGMNPSPAFRRQVLSSWWIIYGDGLRNIVSHDLMLARIMRVLLPPYRGKPLLLYRGEGFPNRQRRTYGMSWSSDLDVARSFAELHRHNYIGGSVLLETWATADAIISASQLVGDGRAEAEYLVDRTFLHAVHVLERFGQV
jgi:hypothetical protein